MAQCSATYKLFVQLIIFSILSSSYVFGFKQGDLVPVYVNKVWPHPNFFEAYKYYEVLELCIPEEVIYLKSSVGQILGGDNFATSNYKIYFNESVDNQVLCQMTIDQHQLKGLKELILQNYIFELVVNDISVSSLLGVYSDDNTVYLSKHIHFMLYYDGSSLSGANIFALREPVLISPLTGVETLSINFTYSVTWNYMTLKDAKKELEENAVILLNSSTRTSIRSTLAINSFALLIVLLVALYILLRRIINREMLGYLHIHDEDLMSVEEDPGWKLLHGDVFRHPPYRIWLCACVGSGAHIFLVILITSIVWALSPFVSRSIFVSVAIFGYASMSFVAGYISANLYRRIGGVQWAMNIFLTLLIFPGFLTAIFLVLHLIAKFHRFTISAPASLILKSFSLWLFVTVPLTTMGAIFGRKFANKHLEKKSAFPCKTNRLPREIPRITWVQSTWLHCFLCGVLLFTTVCVELHQFFLSIWITNFFMYNGLALVAMVAFVGTAICSTILVTYKHLNNEDYRWWWRSFMIGGSVGFYLMLFCVYYMRTTNMTGFVHCSFFFGYYLILSWAFFLAAGFITFAADYVFLIRIYKSIKSD